MEENIDTEIWRKVEVMIIIQFLVNVELKIKMTIL